MQACQAREEELQHALSQRDAEAANAARRVAQAEARLAAKEKAASESAEEAQQAFSRLNDLAEERNRLRTELEDFQVGAQQMQADSKQHLRQLQANRKELDSSSLEVRRLQQDKEELQSQLEKAKSKACALEIEQHQQQERKEQLQQQLRAQEQQLEHAEAASRQMALELEAAQGHVSQTAQTAQRCQGELEEHLEAKSRDVEEARTALQRVVEDNGQLQALLEESQEKAAKLQEQVLCHDDRCKELEEDLILARAQLGALEARESELAQATVAARRQETQEAELADLLAQKELLEAQLAATIARLDEEQAERIRQGARAETLETDLATQQRIYSEQASAARCKTLEHAWHQLAASAAAHIQEMESRKLMSEVIASRRRQVAEHAEILNAQQMKKQAQDDQVQKRQDEDIATCLKENEELRACNRELAQSLQQFKQENDQLHVDNSSLLESVALFEGDLGKVADRHAQLIGHVNKKQKIRYTVKLKEECAQLRLDLNKARHKLMQLEGSRRSDSLYGALASLGYSPAPAVQSSPQPKQRSQEQSPNSPFQQPQAAPAPVRVSPRCANTARGQLEEAQRRVRLQECALERVNSDFRHLLALVQRVIGRGQADESKEINFAELLQDLRRVMASQSHAPQSSTPAMGSTGPKMSPRTEASAGQKEPSTPRARDSLASPLSFRVAQEPLSEEPPQTQDKENQLNIQNQTPAETSKAVLPETSKAILPDTHEAVRKVMKQINFALSFGSRKLYGRPIQDARSFFQALDRRQV
ncbi:Hmmr [Symbiodinium sp. CCMP2592]|nr:Hmmr [Symbiodinium sp. CCMP2592]